MWISRVSRILSRPLGGESGTTLLETVVALAIVSTVAVTFLGGLATTSKATIIANERATAESLAHSQLEYVKNYDYQYGASEYPVDPSLTIPENWSVLPPVVELVHDTDDGIQKVTVTIEHDSEAVFVMEGYKVDR